MRKMILAVAMTAFGASGALAQTNPNAVLHRNAVPSVVNYLFSLSDANRDGALTEAEATAGYSSYISARDERRRMSMLRRDSNALFLAMDKDKNGAISRAEFDAYQPVLVRMGTRSSTGAGSRPARMGLRLDGARFRRGDVNKDGRLTLAEANAMGQYYFDWMDADKNAQVTSAEYANWRNARATRVRTSAR